MSLHHVPNSAGDLYIDICLSAFFLEPTNLNALEPVSPCGGGVVGVRGAMCSIFYATWWIFDELFGFPTGSLGFSIGIKTKETKWPENCNIGGLCNFVWCIYTEILETNVWGYCGLQKVLFGEDFIPITRRTRNSQVRMQALKLASSVETYYKLFHPISSFEQ